MKILIYTEIIENKGIGNFVRMSFLYRYIKENRSDITPFFMVNDIEKAKTVMKFLDIEIDFIEDIIQCDYVVYDSAEINTGILELLKERSKAITALDFFDYETDLVDNIINLYNQNEGESFKFRGRLYSGLDYTVLKDEIIKNRKDEIIKNKDRFNLLISFGGEDPNSNGLKVLEKIDYERYSVSFILSALNRDRDEIIRRYGRKIRILEPVKNIGEYIKKSDLFICGGGTTLLEALYIGTLTVAVAQNELEEKFINYVSEKADVFSIEDIGKMENILSNRDSLEEIVKGYFRSVDGRGKDRILEIVCGGK